MTSMTPQPQVSAKTKIVRRDRRNALRTIGMVALFVMLATSLSNHMFFVVLWALATIVFATALGLQIADDRRAKREDRS